MELVILGSGTCAPSVDRGCAGYLVRLMGKNILMDAGPGSYRQLMKMRVDLAGIENFLITHFHIDHVNDLSAILFTMKNCLPSSGRGGLTIHGPKGFDEKFSKLKDCFGRWILSEDYEIVSMEHGEDEFVINTVTIRTMPMEHGEPSVGYRVDDGQGKSIAYSGDTALCDNIIKLASGCDALLMECTTPDGSRREGHASVSQAAEIAKKAGVKTLVLTHISPENDTTDLEQRAEKIFDGTVIAARDGMRITI